jgi:NAD(P)-dependent dehydrogenase (short-subunit alcohol dehydrogenase family)
MNDFSKNHVLITGGGGGIGLAIAKAFSEKGAHVSITGRNEKKLEGAAGTLSNCQWAVMDVSDEASVKKALAKLIKKFGPVTILINNAGIAESAPLAKMDLGHWKRMLDVNLTGAFLVTREVGPAMQKRKAGRIINIASIAGLEGLAYTSAYCASKHGLVGFTRALADELKKDSVTVNAVCPGFTRTEMVDRAAENIMAKTGMNRDQALAELVKLNAGGRMIEPEEVAKVVLELASIKSVDKTGLAIPLTGEDD